jgi:AAA15 family ATPase/GTPase
MIIEFSVTNYKSFKEKTTFSMVADEKDKTQLQNCFDFNKTTILKSAVIYGANASGKSNFMEAFGILRNLILESAQNSPYENIFQYQPFEFDEQMPNEDVELEIYFIINHIKYFFQCNFNNDAFSKESLYFYPNEKQTLLYKRNFDQFEFGTQLKGEKKAVANLTASNQLYLSNGMINNMPQLIDIYQYFEDKFMAIPFLDGNIEKQYLEMIAKDFYNQEKNKVFYENMLSLMTSLDTGIVNIEIEKRENVGWNGFLMKPRASRIRHTRSRIFNYKIITFHQAKKSDGTLFNQKFELERESTGTQKLFVLVGLVLRALMNGRVIIIDEFERSLHPHISKFIISLFNNKEINTKGAQLIVATHDTELISKDNNFRRDQVWFVEKDENGISDLYALTDVEGIRKDVPFDKWYLTSRLGGVPNLKTFNFKMGFQHETQA